MKSHQKPKQIIISVVSEDIKGGKQFQWMHLSFLLAWQLCPDSIKPSYLNPINQPIKKNADNQTNRAAPRSTDGFIGNN